MRFSGSSAALLALASTTVAEIVKVPVARGPAGSVRRRTPKLTKRASLTEVLVNNITNGGYYASVSVGTPGQDVTLVLDTGSSDAFVLSSDADLCTDTMLQFYYGETCDTTFNSNDSSTFQDIGDIFEIQYADGSAAVGTYVTDDFSIGDKTVKGLQMGLATQTSIGTGILGIGFELNEAAETMYPNLVSTLVNQSIISTKAYSLYLNDYYSSTGSILFGGVDTEKFIGQLAVVPILPDSISESYSSFTVGLTAVSFASANGTTYNASFTAYSDDRVSSILDSGTTLSYLPNDLATDIFDAVGAYIYTSFYESSGLALVDCSLDLEFTFKINNTATLTIPADELVLDYFDQTSIPDDVPFDRTCLFGIQNIGESEDDEPGSDPTGEDSGSQTSSDYAILGDTFLRSAYVVYDLNNLEIGLAQANLNSTASNIQELSASASALSAYSGVASQTANSGGGSSSSSSSGTTSSGSGTSSTSTGGSESSGTESSTSSSGASATSSKSAAGRGAPAYDGLFAVIGISLAFAMSGSLLFWL